MSGQEEEATPYDWDGMPEFDQPEAEAWKVLKVRFRNQEDLMEFAAAIDQMNITTKTKAIIRTSIGSKYPLNPQHQHLGDFTSSLNLKPIWQDPKVKKAVKRIIQI